MRVDVAPVAKPRMTRRDKWAKRPSVVRYWAFCDALRAATKGREFGGALELVFTVPMPKSWSQRKRAEHDGRPHTQRPDLDNYCKAVFDALYEDDSGIHTLTAKKVWGEHGSIAIREIAK